MNSVWPCITLFWERKEGACPKRDTFLHLVGSWAFASSRNHNGKGSQKWSAEQALFLERQKKSLSWYGTILGGMTDGSGQTTPVDDTPASAPSGSADSRRSPTAGNQGRKHVVFHMIRHCSPLAPGGPERLRASRSKLRPGGWRRDEGTQITPPISES